jgi:hypothetical protein
MRTPPQIVGAFLFLYIAVTNYFPYALTMRRILYLSLFVTCSLSAEIYRLVDEGGNVSFSDQPHPDATLIEVNALPTYTPITTSFNVSDSQSIEDNRADIVPDYQVDIISPANDQAFWDNSGTVAIQVQLQPELDVTRGDLIKVMLDGKEIGEPQENTVISLTNIDRGTHSLNVAVVSADQKILSSSDTIKFHLHRRSVINQPNN